MVAIVRCEVRLLTPVLLLVGLVSVSCSDDATPDAATSTGNITVFAASSLSAAFTALGEAFEAKYPDAHLTFNFAASSELVTQIDEGAPADVYAAADLSNMSRLTATGNNRAESVVFGRNVMALLVAPGNPLGITGVADLADDDLIVVICAPEVPCGSYATQIFDNAGVAITPKSLEANVKAVVSKVTLGEADAGIVYETDVVAVGDDATGVAIAADINVVAEYPIVVTRHAANPRGAQMFVDFVMSADGQAVLTQLGFRAP